MSERPEFLSVPYGAYHHRDLPAEDAELTHVGPGTAGGEYLRRFWQPVALSSELGDLPLRVRVLGEDLVLFRDRRGRVGLLELHCPHRGKISTVQFADAWGAMPLIDWVETPLGMVYVTTRRWGDHAWVRSNDAILPNLNQVGAIWEDGSEEKIFTRTGLTRFTLPIDDTHCMIIGWRHFHPSVDRQGKGDERRCGKEMVDFFGQDGNRPYEERQRVPEDYDAQVSQRPIAIHALEHLATTDRGVIMYRRLLRQEIRKVAAGQPPRPLAKAGEIIPTYTHDSVLRVPARPGRDDTALLLDVGRRVTDIVVQGEYHGSDRRLGEIEHRMRALAAEANGPPRAT